MKLPARRLGDWAQEIVEECYSSREPRRDQIKTWQSYYFTGTAEGTQSRYNRCYAHVDRLASYLFSPADVRFSIEFDLTEPEEIQSMAQAAARHLNREFDRCGVDTAFSQANNWALVKGCTLVKTLWGHQGLEPWVVHPEFFGVLREDIEDLDRQEAFVHSTYMTRAQFARTLVEHPEKDDIIKKVMHEADAGSASQDLEDSFFHQIIVGGANQPVGTGGTSSGQGNVGIVGVPRPQLAKTVAEKLIRLDELWVLDDEREDWTTIRTVGGSNICVEGKYKRRNLSGVEQEHPFTKVCPNDVDGYFWGMSEISQIYMLQNLLTDQIRDITRLTKLKAAPPRVLIGFSGMTQEKYKVLNRPNGFIAEEAPTAKLETLAPEIPPELFKAVDQTVSYFDDVAGFQPIMQGVGETGVRSQGHAQTLARNASPRMRDRALLVERQCVSVGDFCLKLLQAKKAQVFDTEKKEQFMLSQLPEDYRVTIDSHTSSPAFSEDARSLAFQLQRAGAIDAADLIMLTHPPHEDSLILRAKQRAQAEAEMLKQHPELMSGKKKRK